MKWALHEENWNFEISKNENVNNLEHLNLCEVIDQSKDAENIATNERSERTKSANQWEASGKNEPTSWCRNGETSPEADIQKE